MTRDPRFDAAAATNDGAGRGWDFRRDVPSASNIIRNIPGLIALVVVGVSFIALAIMIGGF